MAVDAVKCVIFDLDGTLTSSKEPMDVKMADALVRLLQRLEVSIITGGRWELLERQVLEALPEVGGEDSLARLHLLPACGTQYRRWRDGVWQEEYRVDLPKSARKEIARVLVRCARELGLYEARHWGNLIDDRGGQVTYSVFGQDAPLHVKLSWDPDGRKKERIRHLAAQQLPDFSVACGASSSIDVTAPGVNKSYGVRRLAEVLTIDTAAMIYVGDRLDNGGNDSSVLGVNGICCVQVRDWRGTHRWATKLLRELARSG